jgi:hypothetical protein
VSRIACHAPRSRQAARDCDQARTGCPSALFRQNALAGHQHSPRVVERLETVSATGARQDVEVKLLHQLRPATAPSARRKLCSSSHAAKDIPSPINSMDVPCGVRRVLRKSIAGWLPRNKGFIDQPIVATKRHLSGGRLRRAGCQRRHPAARSPTRYVSLVSQAGSRLTENSEVGTPLAPGRLATARILRESCLTSPT